MSQSSHKPPPARSWREIPQPVKPRTMGREGRRRLAMAVGNIVGIVLVLGAAAWGVFEVIRVWENDPARITAPTKGAPIRDYTLRTDGVLGRDWVVRTLALPPAASLMELDLVALKRLLEASGQVSKAVIERRFPDVLGVTLQERMPVARIMARIGDAAPVVFLVARDGIVYSGAGYDPAMIEGLPFLDGVRLTREGAGFVPVEGMTSVADLLGTAQGNTPDLYRTFKVVSLARFADDRTLIVKSTEVDAIIFGASSDGFYKQLARLDYILDEARRHGPGQLKTVNLAIGGTQVPVSFDHEVSAQASARPHSSPSRPAAGAGLFVIPSRNSSPTSRDF